MIARVARPANRRSIPLRRDTQNTSPYGTISSSHRSATPAIVYLPWEHEGHPDHHALHHIAMHAMGKITLFFCAGAIYVAAGKKYISQMDGLGRRMPITYLAFFLGSLSIIGMPPLGGFWSKWFLGLATLDADQLAMLGPVTKSAVRAETIDAVYPSIREAFGLDFHDTFWQTETGAIMISPLPGVTATKPGSAQRALPGIAADVIDVDTLVDLDTLDFRLDQSDRGQPLLVPGLHGGFHGRLDGLSEGLVAH